MLSRTATRCHLCHVARAAEELKLHTFKISLNGYTRAASGSILDSTGLAADCARGRDVLTCLPSPLEWTEGGEGLRAGPGGSGLAGHTHRPSATQSPSWPAPGCS